jgi:hypothetical protein
MMLCILVRLRLSYAQSWHFMVIIDLKYVF